MGQFDATRVCAGNSLASKLNGEEITPTKNPRESKAGPPLNGREKFVMAGSNCGFTAANPSVTPTLTNNAALAETTNELGRSAARN
jgi:hypothetical protein